jgi:hypothetical protein
MSVLSLTENKEQKQITYRIVESICKTHGSEGELVYGVEVELSGECNDYMKIEDICVNKSEIDHLINRLKEGQVTPDQLLYIVEDYLAELNSPNQ